MLTQLTTVKYRLGLAEAEIAHDALLAMFIQAATARFQTECHRVFGRTENAAFEFPADTLKVAVPCYPVESVARFELKFSELELWTERPGVECLVRGRCVIALPGPLGGARQAARVIYTGGYVLPGEVPEAGQEKLPADLEQAAIEQVAFWYQHRDRQGLSRVWDYHSTYRQFAGQDLLAGVRAVLERHRRMNLG